MQLTPLLQENAFIRRLLRQRMLKHEFQFGQMLLFVNEIDRLQLG